MFTSRSRQWSSAVLAVLAGAAAGAAFTRGRSGRALQRTVDRALQGTRRALREMAERAAHEAGLPGSEAQRFIERGIAWKKAPRPGRRPTEPAPDVVDHVLELPFDAQLGVLRTIAPRILSRLSADERSGYERDLREEIARADRGEPTYDVRPGRLPAVGGRAVRTVAIIADDHFEDSELRVPLHRLREAGHRPVVIGAAPHKPLRGKHGRENVLTDVSVDDVTADSFDALVIPGGYSPDHLRTIPAMVHFTRAFFDAGKPVAAICHGPSMLVEADVVRGRTVTSWPSVKTDLVNAGAEWVDREVVVDGNLITSRKPSDLAAFCDALLRALSEREPARVSPERLPESAARIPEAMSAAPARA